MAFTAANLRMGCEFGIFRNHRWHYETATPDDAAAMNTSGFFNGIAALGAQIGDEILATEWTTAVPTGGHPVNGTSAITARHLFQVVSISTAGVVDVSNGDARTMTDSD